MSLPKTSRQTDQPESAGDGTLAVSRPLTPAGSRRPYESPSLMAYGRLAELTRFGGSAVVDSGGGLGRRP